MYMQKIYVCKTYKYAALCLDLYTFICLEQNATESKINVKNGGDYRASPRLLGTPHEVHSRGIIQGKNTYI